jgi:hypothetical protein
VCVCVCVCVCEMGDLGDRINPRKYLEFNQKKKKNPTPFLEFSEAIVLQ